VHHCYDLTIIVIFGAFFHVYLQVHTCICDFLIIAMYAYTSHIACGSEDDDVIHNKHHYSFNYLSYLVVLTC